MTNRPTDRRDGRAGGFTSNNLLSGVTPEGLGVGRVGGRDPRVARASPEPAVHIDGLHTVEGKILNINRYEER